MEHQLGLQMHGETKRIFHLVDVQWHNIHLEFHRIRFSFPHRHYVTSGWHPMAWSSGYQFIMNPAARCYTHTCHILRFICIYWNSNICLFCLTSILRLNFLCSLSLSLSQSSGCMAVVNTVIFKIFFYLAGLSRSLKGDLKLSLWRVSRGLSSGMLHCTVWYILTDDSNELIATIIRVTTYKWRVPSRSCKTSVNIYQTTRCKIPEHSHIQFEGKQIWDFKAGERVTLKWIL